MTQMTGTAEKLRRWTLVSEEENVGERFDEFIRRINQNEIPKERRVCHCGHPMEQCEVSKESGETIKCWFCGEVTIPHRVRYFTCMRGTPETHGSKIVRICVACMYTSKVQVFYDRGKWQIGDEAYPHKLSLRMMVDGVMGIDTAHQSFRARLRLVVSWKPSEEDLEHFERNPHTFKPSFVPRLSFPNMLSTNSARYRAWESGNIYEIFKAGQPFVGCVSVLPYMVAALYEIDADFSEEFEFHNFPVDCQDLTICVESPNSTSVAQFVTPYESSDMVTLLEEFITLSEWKLHSPTLEITNKKSTLGSRSHSKVNLSLKLQRNSNFYFWKLVVFVTVLTCCALSAFSVDPEVDAGDRIALLVTLLLTAVTFHFVAASELPNVPYLTLLDKYLLASFLFIFAILIESGLVASKSLDMAFLDPYLLIVFGCAFAAIQGGFAYLVKTGSAYEEKKLVMSQSEICQYGTVKKATAVSTSVDKSLVRT